MADLGTDILMRDGDIDMGFATVSGRDCLIADLVRRLQTAAASLFWAQGDGKDLRDELNKKHSPETVSRLQTAIVRELQRDDRVIAARARVTLNPDSTMRVEMFVQDGDGPFSLVVSVNNLTVEQLFP